MPINLVLGMFQHFILYFFLSCGKHVCSFVITVLLNTPYLCKFYMIRISITKLLLDNHNMWTFLVVYAFCTKCLLPYSQYNSTAFRFTWLYTLFNLTPFCPRQEFFFWHSFYILSFTTCKVCITLTPTFYHHYNYDYFF